MSNSRRKFLKAGMLAAMFAAVPLKHALGHGWKDNAGNPDDQSSVPYDPLANYTKATFQYYLNSIFQLRTVRGVVAVTLLRIDDLPAPKGGECFSLLFRGGSTALSQNTYIVDHAALGTFLLFLVPVGTDNNGAQGYLATINRLSLSEPAASPTPAGSGSGSVKRSGSLTTTTATPTPTPAPADVPPQIITPAQPAAPVITKPAVQPKPKASKKPWWKRNSDDDLEEIN